MISGGRILAPVVLFSAALTAQSLAEFQLPPKSVFDNPKTVSIPLPGQLRVVQIAPAFRAGDATDPHAGIYYFSILPMYGFPGGQKQQLPWASGNYVFRVTYRDGDNVGSTLGSLVIP